MIDIVNVSKSFGRVRALEGVTLRIAAGERVAIVGTNGSGKTTLLRALVGLTRVQGTIAVDGISVAGDPARALERLAYIPQVSPAIDVPVLGVARTIADLRGFGVDDVRRHAESLGLAFAAVEGVRFRDLSGGMRQKFLAALALAASTPLLVADEPTASLDEVSRRAFEAAIAARGPGATFVLCSHRAEEVERLVTRVVELREGRVVRDERIAKREAA
jgi:ABC-2 type transport system ATP-binding protein